MAVSLRPCLCIFFCLAAATQAAKVTPMEKVIGLLKDLSAKVAAEGKKEAAQYDKYACFCKEQADEKLYSIEKSDAKIKDLKAEIEELTTAIAALDKDISDLSSKITDRENEIEDKTETRKQQRAEYEAKAKDMNEAIAACGAAIDALKGSKGSLSDAKVDLVQVNAKVALLSKLAAKAAPKFQYQSNDIIATLEDLLATFKEMKKDLDFAEHDTNSSFEKARLGLANEKKFAEKERAEKEAIVESKTEDLNAAKSDRDDEQDDRDADDTFMKELTNSCEEKAELFDQRSSLRADELSTLAEATTKLQEGAVPNFAANKKLVGLQKSVASPVTLVQINSVQHQQSGKGAVLQRVRNFLDDAADRTGSRTLSALAVRVSVAEDHFVKVRGLIKDLIAKLKNDAKEEATQKGVCDKGMSTAISERDEANANMEAANAQITTDTAKQNALEDEIAKLNGNIADLKKAFKEATELRNTDKAENEKTVDMSQGGADAVELALELLKNFYDGAQLVQTGYTPPGAGRDGKNLADLAPEFADSEYKGSQSESKGIVGILEVILSDFQRTNAKAKTDDGESKDTYDKFETDTDADVDKKEKRIKKANGEVADAKASILEQQQALSDATDLLDSATAALEKFEAMCVKGEETWEERKQKREDEVEALKSALNILEDWQGF